MTHLEQHPHAFINSSGYVVQIAAFNEHDNELLQSIKTQLEENSNEKLDVICCCDHGSANIGWRWTDSCWQPPSPYPSWVWNGIMWDAPAKMPTDGKIYYWDENSIQWLEAL
jgi:hypothetical protein